jgi:hypothetical protein
LLADTLTEDILMALDLGVDVLIMPDGDDAIT